MEVEITSTNKCVFIVEHFMNTYKIEKRRFFKSTYKLYNVIYLKHNNKKGTCKQNIKKSSRNLEITVT